MKKFLTLSIIILCLIVNPAYSEPDDDSTPYNPYPEPPAQPQNNNPAPKKTVRKVRAKKPAPKPRPTPKKIIKPAPKPDYLQQAKILLEQGRYNDAKPYLIKAIQTNRRDANVWYWYGKYFEYIGSFSEAQYYYTKALEIDPAFEPLSRVVYYPNDPLKTPLWDPKRPARIYPVETSGRGIAAVPPNALDRNKYPTAPNDPQVPHVPVYTPPEPGAIPLDGDSWSPSLYVPPAHDEVETPARTPAYVPPSNNSIIAEGSSIYNQVSADPIIKIQTPPSSEIVRADKPLYNPPEPGQQLTAKNIKQPRRNTPAKPAKIQTKTKTQRVPVKIKTKPKSQPVKTPAKKVERQQRNTQRTPTPPTRQTQPTPPSPPRQQTQPAPQTTTPPTPPQTPAPRQTPNPIPAPEPTRPTPPSPRIPAPEPEQPQRPQQQYLPPVGQFPPDPGTISETPIPPVGQGNQE